MSPTKMSRIEVRAEEELVELIKRAAKSVHEPASEFVRKAALARADVVLNNQLVTVMPVEQFDDLMSSLDDADEVSRLASEAAKPAAFVRR